MKKKTIIPIGIILGVLMISLATAYTSPSYTNVTLVLKGGYTAPSYTNVTLVLGDTTTTSNCWTKTNNIITIPNGCVYSIPNGVIG